jgi:hypothetical protein
MKPFGNKDWSNKHNVFNTGRLMEQELEYERERLSKALGAIPKYLTETRNPSVVGLSEASELSVAEVLLDNWEDVIKLVEANERLKGEVDRLLRQVEQLSTGIQQALETALRPVRDARISDVPTERAD